MNINVRKNSKYLLITICFILTFFSILLPGWASAASLYFSPSSGSYTVGNNLSVSVYVSSNDKSMNAASGVITFPTDRLKVIGLSKDGSIVNLWAQEPSFSNAQGTIQFEGVVLNPGFIGSAGKLITLQFKVIGGDNGSLNFSSGSVLANDGQGTEILIGKGGANFSFKPVVAEPITPVPEVITPIQANTVPPAPQISSSTHPDQTKWYKNKYPKFSWKLSSDITGVRVLYDKNPDSDPKILYTPAIAGKDLEDLADGSYYLHVQFRNAEGWGKISNFRFQIDTQNPEYLNLEEITRQDLTDPRVKFKIESKDVTSGIDRYEINIDSGNIQVWNDDGSHILEIPPTDPGKHVLSIKAFDKAGNYINGFVDFLIDSLGEVVITDYPKQLNISNTLFIKGISPPNLKINLFLQKEGSDAIQYTGESDGKGFFTFSINGNIKEGKYKVWAIATDSKGAKSNPSKEITISMQQPLFSKFGPLAINILTILILFVVLIFLLVFFIFWMKHKASLMRNKIEKDIDIFEGKIHKAFDELKEDLRAQVRMIEKINDDRPLTDIEEKIIKNLKKNLDKAEKVIKKEVKKIEEHMLQ
jgi:hypothetical protein